MSEEAKPTGREPHRTMTTTITLTDRQLEVILEAVQTRLAMGRFELDELRRHFGGVAVDAVVSTQLRVDELVSVLNVLLRSEP